MRLIDADKLEPDRMTDKGLAISQSQIANAPTVCDIEQIRAEIEHWESDDTQDDYQMGAMDMQKYILRVIDKYREEQTDAT